MVSWNVQERPSEFFAFFMFLATSVLGVFSSLEPFLLFFFFELAVFPKYLMIVLWGSPKTRDYGAMKLTLYLFTGSVVALIGALAIYFGSNPATFDLLALEKAGFPTEFQRPWFFFVFLGFAILRGIFPFHSWAPDGHITAPTAVSMLLAGVEMKVGAFAALRVGIMLLPEGRKVWSLCDNDPGNDQRRLWRVDRHDPDRFQVRHWVFFGLPHGAGADRFCHAKPRRSAGRRDANVFARHHDGCSSLPWLGWYMIGPIRVKCPN